MEPVILSHRCLPVPSPERKKHKNTTGYEIVVHREHPSCRGGSGTRTRTCEVNSFVLDQLSFSPKRRGGIKRESLIPPFTNNQERTRLPSRVGLAIRLDHTLVDMIYPEPPDLSRSPCRASLRMRFFLPLLGRMDDVSKSCRVVIDQGSSIAFPLAGTQGLEPRLAGSEPGVLPLDDVPML